MLTTRARWFVVLPTSLLALSANAETEPEPLTATRLSAVTETNVNGSLTPRIVQTGFDNGSTVTSNHDNLTASPGNTGSAGASASASRALAVGGNPPIVIKEFPATASAEAYASVSADRLFDNYTRNPSNHNAGQFLTLISVGSASVDYSQAWNTKADASDDVKGTAIPLEIRVVWTVSGTSEGFIDTGVGTVALTMASGQQGYSTFRARATQGALHLVYDGFSEEAEVALDASGGLYVDGTDYAARPFKFMHYPNTPLTFHMVAEAGASVIATVNNGWMSDGIGTAFIDPIVRVDPSYPYLDQLELVVSDGYYIETQELYNPLVGTRFERIGETLINAPYNTVPIPEPHSWVLLLGGVGLILARARHRASTAH